MTSKPASPKIASSPASHDDDKVRGQPEAARVAGSLVPFTSEVVELGEQADALDD
ncbi:MAG: hypothetical protein ACT4OX_13350 [Actinomycetota bacterium]